jgi:GT2 family glycosyltransferase
MNDLKKIAIVVLNWNGRKLLEEFLPSLVMHNHKDAQLYMADNASTDDSLAYVRANFPSIKIIQNSQNGGYAKGYNDALERVEEPLLCLINSDVEVTANWLNPILEQFEIAPKIAVIQPKILAYKNKTHFEYAGAAGGFLDKYAYPFCRGRIFDTLEEDKGQYDDTKLIFWASGACLFIRKAVFEEIGKFDESYFAHQEEIDLCWRINNASYEVWYNSNSVIYHLGGATLNSQNPKKTFLNFRNSLFNIVKNAPKKNLFLLVLTRLLLDGVAGVKLMLALKPLHTWAIVKAHFSFYAHLFEMLAKRNENTAFKKYYLTKSIVWQYYIKGKKYFLNLD